MENQTQVPILTLALTSYMVLGKVSRITKSQCPYLLNVDNYIFFVDYCKEDKRLLNSQFMADKHQSFIGYQTR